MNYTFVDLEFLRNFTQNNEEQMKKFVRIFLDNAPNLLQQMVEGHKTGDFQSLRTAVHTLKSQTGYMGMNAIKPTILEVEKLAAEQLAGNQLDEGVAKIHSFLNSGIEELHDFVK